MDYPTLSNTIQTTEPGQLGRSHGPAEDHGRRFQHSSNICSAVVKRYQGRQLVAWRKGTEEESKPIIDVESSQDLYN